MHDARSRMVLVLVVAWLCPVLARADAISVKMVTQVPAGQQPRLTVTALEPVDKVEILLNRDDGKMVEETIEDLGAGGFRDIMLDGTPGKHQYSGRITAVAQGKPSSSQVVFETIVASEITVVIDKS